MELRHVKTKKCPACGESTIVMECLESNVWHNPREIRVHTNGTRPESREFLCGFRTEFVPNFIAEKQARPCTQSPEYLEREKSRVAIKAQISELEDQLRKI